PHVERLPAGRVDCKRWPVLAELRPESGGLGRGNKQVESILAAPRVADDVDGLAVALLLRDAVERKLRRLLPEDSGQGVRRLRPLEREQRPRVGQVLYLRTLHDQVAVE